MKKVIKLLFITILVFPIIIFADRTFDDAVSKANKFVYTINEYNRYFNTSDGLPYMFNKENGSEYSSRFTKGGFLNKYELEIASSNLKTSTDSSYLTPGIEFWLADGSRVSTKIMNDASTTSGVRITEFTGSSVETIGKGTKDEPWVMQDGYTITIGTNDKSKGTVSPTNVYHVGKDLSKTYEFTINTVAGYNYSIDNCTKGINARNAVITEENKKISVTKVTGNVSCYVKFDSKCLKISFDDQNGSENKGYEGQNYYLRYGVGWYSDSACTEPMEIKLPNALPKKRGYLFEGYYTGKTLVDKGLAFISKDGLIELNTTTLKQDTTIYAIWKARTYTLTYGGYSTHASCSNCTSKTVTYDQTFGTLPTITPNAGYSFLGWKLDGNYVTKDSLVRPNNYEDSTITLQAEVTPNEYTVTFDPKGGSVNPTTKKATYDSAVGSLPTPSKEGYTFKGWYDSSDNLYTQSTIYKVVGNITLSAKYNKCKEGYYCPGNNEETKCPVGTYSGEGQKECTPCPAGTYNNETGKSSCTTCNSGYYTNTGNNPGATTCTICSKGNYCDGKVMTACAAGKYQGSQGKSSCDTCNSGYYTDKGNNTGATTCTICSKGHYCDGKVSNACAAGKYQSSQGKSSCDTCNSGYYTDKGNNPGATTCTICSKGHYCDGKVSNACAAGKYQNSEGQSSCKKCSAGKYSSGEGATVCNSCDYGTYQDSEGQTSCKDCSAGTYQNEQGKTSCKDCTTGHYCLARSTNPTPCSPGTYQPYSRKSYCDTCPSGQYSGEGATYCSSCNTGYHVYNNSCTANTYTISYNANGGSGSMSDTSCSYGSNCTLRNNSFSWSNHSFVGWSTSASASSATYSNGQNVSNLTSTDGGSVTLYAVWESSVPYPKHTFTAQSYSWLVKCSSNCTSNQQCGINSCCSAGTLIPGAEIYLVKTEGIFGYGYVKVDDSNFGTVGAGGKNASGQATSCSPYGFQYGVYGGEFLEGFGSEYKKYIYIRFVYKTDEYGGAWQYFLKDEYGNIVP